MGSIVEGLGEVRRAAGSSWCHGDAVAEWAAPFGSDLRSAWNSCHRGDYLASLTSLVGFDPNLLQREVTGVARALLSRLPEHHDAFAKLVDHVARNRPLPPTLLEEAEREATALRTIEEEELANERAHRPAMVGALGATLQFIATSVSTIAEEERVAAMHVRLAAAFTVVPELQRLREFHRARHRRTAAAFALRALLAALSLTQVSQALITMRIAVQAGSRRSAGKEASTLDERAYLHRLAAHAADFYHHAALAHTWAIGATEPAWSAGLDGLARGCVAVSDAIVRGDEATLRRMWVEFAFALSDHMEGVARELLAHYAHELRQSVDPRTLCFDAPDRVTIPVAPERSADSTRTPAREELREDLDWLSRLAARLESHELIEAIEVARAILQAPGPLEPTRIARVMVTVHARFVDMMTSRADALDDPRERQAWYGIRDTLDSRFRQMIDENAQKLAEPVDTLN